MAMLCPYCDSEINEKHIESEDGCCPECGAFISPNLVVSDGEDEDDEYDEEFNDDDLGDEFSDEDMDMEGNYDDDYDDKDE